VPPDRPLTGTKIANMPMTNESARAGCAAATGDATMLEPVQTGTAKLGDDFLLIVREIVAPAKPDAARAAGAS